MTHRSRSMATVSGTPWRSLLSSFPVWSCMIGNFAYLYIFFLVGQYGPTYFSEVLQLDIEHNGYMSGLPFLAQIVGRMFVGLLSDYKMCEKNPTLTLKFFNTIAVVGSIGCCLGITLLEAHVSYQLSTMLFCGILFFASLGSGGFQRSPLHIAPQHCGVIGALTNFSGMVSTIILPYVVSGNELDKIHT